MVFMHSRGTPADMMSEENTKYGNIIDDITKELLTQLDKANAAGVPLWNQVVDPGIGFAKRRNENLHLLRPDNVQLFQRKLGDRPVMIGASRKRFLQDVLEASSCNDGSSPLNRDVGTAAVTCAAQLAEAFMVRVHNVRVNKQALSVFRAIIKSK
jgi:dihydropteroate synthase